MSVTRNTFTKTERLKSRKKIQEIFTSGRVIYLHPFKALYLTEQYSGDTYPAQIAISVSKRNFRKAVQRNAIKRKVREACRLHKSGFYKSLIKNEQMLKLFVIYTAKEEYDFHKIENEMKNLLNKISRKVLKELTSS